MLQISLDTEIMQHIGSIPRRRRNACVWRKLSIVFEGFSVQLQEVVRLGRGREVVGHRKSIFGLVGMEPYVRSPRRGRTCLWGTSVHDRDWKSRAREHTKLRLLFMCFCPRFLLLPLLYVVHPYLRRFARPLELCDCKGKVLSVSQQIPLWRLHKEGFLRSWSAVALTRGIVRKICLKHKVIAARRVYKYASNYAGNLINCRTARRRLRREVTYNQVLTERSRGCDYTPESV